MPAPEHDYFVGIKLLDGTSRLISGPYTDKQFVELVLDEIWFTFVAMYKEADLEHELLVITEYGILVAPHGTPHPPLLIPAWAYMEFVAERGTPA